MRAMNAFNSASVLTAWYLLRSTGSLRKASSRAAASEIGAPFGLAALSSLLADALRRPAGSRGRHDVRRRQRRENAGAAGITGIGIDVGRIDLRELGDAARQRGK